VTQSEYIAALQQALTDYDTLIAQIASAVVQSLESLHQRCEALLRAEIDQDGAEPWTAEQLDHLARQYNAIMDTHGEKPVIIATAEAMKQLRETGQAR